MPNLRSQTIITNLVGDPKVESLTVAKSNIWVPDHTHDISTLTGLGKDVMQQYLTENRAFDFIESWWDSTPDKTEAENVGNGIGLFITKNGSILRFKTILAGDNISITEDTIAGTITIGADLDDGLY